MKVITHLCALLSLALFLAGCGGNGRVFTLPNWYAGSWIGDWRSVTSDTNLGEVLLTIDEEGNILGEFSNPESEELGSFTGTIQPNGQFSITGTLGINVVTVTGTASHEGLVKLVLNGRTPDETQIRFNLVPFLGGAH